MGWKFRICFTETLDRYISHVCLLFLCFEKTFLNVHLDKLILLDEYNSKTYKSFYFFIIFFFRAVASVAYV